MAAAGGGGDGDGQGGERNLANSAVSAALRYRAQAPVIDGLMKELGFDGATFDGLVAGAAADEKPAPKPNVQARIKPPPSGTAKAAE